VKRSAAVVVHHGDYIITHENGRKEVLTAAEFEREYEPTKEQPIC